MNAEHTPGHHTPDDAAVIAAAFDFVARFDRAHAALAQMRDPYGSCDHEEVEALARANAANRPSRP